MRGLGRASGAYGGFAWAVSRAAVTLLSQTTSDASIPQVGTPTRVVCSWLHCGARALARYNSPDRL